ncbi:MAG: sigma-70 family RNA polymerase sigma factor [Acidobacteriota bacterium]|jgi:RNA polymerase sigma-70 factor (ECF subfamily)
MLFAIMSGPGEVTHLLHAWAGGDRTALDRLIPIVYSELHRLAHRYMSKERAGHALMTTELIHEAYLKLADLRSLDWQDRHHFYAISARQMRRILVDFARTRDSQKRGGDFRRVTFEEQRLGVVDEDIDLVALDEALDQLAEFDERKARVVELRFFGGLSVKETADLLRVSPDTVLRDWRLARAWLIRRIRE